METFFTYITLGNYIFYGNSTSGPFVGVDHLWGITFYANGSTGLESSRAKNLPDSDWSIAQ